MNLQSTDFEIFDLPQRFALDKAALDDAWKTLQRQAHPDRHASDSAQQQRQAMQWSVRINEAYQRLKARSAEPLTSVSCAVWRFEPKTTRPCRVRF